MEPNDAQKDQQQADSGFTCDAHVLRVEERPRECGVKDDGERQSCLHADERQQRRGCADKANEGDIEQDVDTGITTVRL